MQRYKFPRTPHLKWSDSITSGDKIFTGDFTGKNVVVTLKMDGENTAIYWDGYFHARSINPRPNASRDWVKSNVIPHFQYKLSTLRPYIDKPVWRIYGENMYAKHSIFYDDLKSYFYCFLMVDHEETCFDFREMQSYCIRFDLSAPPVIYSGVFDEGKIKRAFEPFKEKHEGYVVRVTGSFLFSDYSKNVAKYVRKNHIQTDEHWLDRPIVKNQLKEYLTKLM